MIMAHSRRSRLSAAKSLNDIQQGDFVRRVMGSRKVGLVEEVGNGWAWVLWSKDRRDYLPFVALRQVRAGGAHLDSPKADE